MRLLMYIYLMKLTWLKSNVILLHKLIYSHPYLNDSETLLQKGAMENKSSKPLHQCYNISGFPSNQQKRVSERTLIKVRGQGHSARSKSTGLLQVWENPDTVYREDAVYCLGHAAEGGAGHAGLRLRLLPPRTFCGGHDLSIYVSYFFLIILFVFCLSCSFKSGNGKILWKNYFIDKTCYTVNFIHDDKHYYYLYNQKSCHWENLNILTCYLFYVMEF